MNRSMCKPAVTFPYFCQECQPNKMMSVLVQPFLMATDFIFQVRNPSQERAVRHACRNALLGSSTNLALTAICASHVAKAAMPSTLCLVGCRECWCLRGASLNAPLSSSIKSGKVLVSQASLRANFCMDFGMVDVCFVLCESSQPTIPAFQAVMSCHLMSCPGSWYSETATLIITKSCLMPDPIPAQVGTMHPSKVSLPVCMPAAGAGAHTWPRVR